jgi:maltodextrin utilization protein YvdJ
LIFSAITALSWLAHPWLLWFIDQQAEASEFEKRLYSNISIIGGLAIMALLIFAFKRFSLHSFPGLRESKKLWFSLVGLQVLAGVIIALELIIFNHNINWILSVFLAVIVVLSIFCLRLPFQDRNK